MNALYLIISESVKDVLPNGLRTISALWFVICVFTCCMLFQRNDEGEAAFINHALTRELRFASPNSTAVLMHSITLPMSITPQPY